MRNLFYLCMAIFVSSTSIAKEPSKVEEDVLIAYSTEKATIHIESKTFIYNGEDLTIYVGLDSNYEVSEISVSDNISEKDLSSLKTNFAAGSTCLTRCSRSNDCAGKGTSAGVIGCYAECAIDCADDLIDLKEKPDDEDVDVH